MGGIATWVTNDAGGQDPGTIYPPEKAPPGSD